MFLGILPGVRFLYFYFSGDRVGHVQSLILSAILTIVGFQVLLIGLLADLMSASRRIQEDTVYRVKRLELGLQALRERWSDAPTASEERDEAEGESES